MNGLQVYGLQDCHQFRCLISDMEDTPLAFGRLAGLPRVQIPMPVSEVLPLESALLVVGLALVCVWAVQCSY